MSLYRVLHGEFESAVKMDPNIVKISIFTNFSKKLDFYKKYNFNIYIYIWVHTSIYIYIYKHIKKYLKKRCFFAAPPRIYIYIYTSVYPYIYIYMIKTFFLENR